MTSLHSFSSIHVHSHAIFRCNQAVLNYSVLLISVLTDDEQGFQLRLFCECIQTVNSSFSFSIAGITSGRGDIGKLQFMKQQPPYILTMSIPQNVSSHLTSRKKRSTENQDACSA